MRLRPQRWALLLLLVAGLLQAQDTMPLQRIELRDGDRVHAFWVEVAATPEQRRQGLMHRQQLPCGQGMLFQFPKPVRVAFWMRNTLIPLDILFIRDGRVIHVHHQARALDETRIHSPEPVDQVLEINAGRARALSLGEGARVTYAPLE